MMHKTRVWCVQEVASEEELARMVTQRSWTLCSAFELKGYLFLNDATSENGGQEYAVVKRPTDAGKLFLQLESITFSWCREEVAHRFIRQATSGEMERGNDLVQEVKLVIQTPAEHGHCPLCA